MPLFTMPCPSCGCKLKRNPGALHRDMQCPRCGALVRGERIVERDPLSDRVLPKVIRSKDRASDDLAMLSMEFVEGVAVVSFRRIAVLDRTSVQQLGDDFDTLLDTYDLDKIALDFGHAEFLSSAVIGKLTTLLRRLHEKGGHLRLCCVSDPVLAVLRTMRLHKTLGVCKSRQQALKQLRKK